MDIAEKVLLLKQDYDDVHNAGFGKGYETGRRDGEEYAYFVGLENGKKAEYDAFWDINQDNGNRTDYDCAYGGLGYTEKTFKPKYSIRPTAAAHAFRKNNANIDLTALDIDIDFSQCTTMGYCFYYSAFSKLGLVDCSSCITLDATFAYMTKCHTIEGLVVTEKNKFTNTFVGCSNLELLLITGTIAQNGLDLHWSTKLSGESIVSVIESLSTTTSGITATLSQTAVDNMTFPITSNQTGTVYNSWEELIETRSNWTIALS